MEDFAHVLGDMTKPRDTINLTSCHPKNAIEGLQSDLWEPLVERGTMVLSISYKGMQHYGGCTRVGESEKTTRNGSVDNNRGETTQRHVP